MRVLYIHQYFSTPAGASGTRSYEFSRHLVEQGHQVTVLTGASAMSDLRPTRWIERRSIDGIDVILIGVPYANRMAYPTRILSFGAFMIAATVAAVANGRPDVVFASSTPLTVGVPGMMASWMYRVPFVFEVRDLWPKYAVAYGVLRNRWLIRAAEVLERLCYARASRIVTICETIAQEIREAGGPAEKLVCIPIGADLGHLLAPAGQRARPFRVVYTGAHSTVNALDGILDAARVLMARGAPVEFHFVGDGRDKARLEARAADEGLTNVSFFTPVAKERIPAILEDADACVITARDIPEAQAILPNKFFDYIAAGRPVIVNFSGELARLIESERIGLVVPNGDAVAFADAIDRLASAQALCRELGSRARALATARFDRRLLARQLEHIFIDVVEPQARAPQRTDRRAG